MVDGVVGIAGDDDVADLPVFVGLAMGSFADRMSSLLSCVLRTISVRPTAMTSPEMVPLN